MFQDPPFSLRSVSVVVTAQFHNPSILNPDFLVSRKNRARGLEGLGDAYDASRVSSRASHSVTSRRSDSAPTDTCRPSGGLETVESSQ